MGWVQILIAAVVPTSLGLLVAWPFWARRQEVVGNAVGAGVLFAAIIFLIGSTFVADMRADQACVAGLARCGSRVDAHMPFLTYALIAVVDASVLFWISLKVEESRAPKSWLPSDPAARE